MSARKKKTGQILHMRAWQYGRAVTACQGTTSATTTPDLNKVNCNTCKAKATV